MEKHSHRLFDTCTHTVVPALSHCLIYFVENEASFSLVKEKIVNKISSESFLLTAGKCCGIEVAPLPQTQKKKCIFDDHTCIKVNTYCIKAKYICIFAGMTAVAALLEKECGRHTWERE